MDAMYVAANSRGYFTWYIEVKISRGKMAIREKLLAKMLNIANVFFFRVEKKRCNGEFNIY